MEYAENFYLPCWWMLETADRKLVEWPESGEVELYDTAADPHETTNIAGDEPSSVADMRAVLVERKREPEGLRQFRDAGPCSWPRSRRCARDPITPIPPHPVR